MSTEYSDFEEPCGVTTAVRLGIDTRSIPGEDWVEVTRSAAQMAARETVFGALDEAEEEEKQHEEERMAMRQPIERKLDATRVAAELELIAKQPLNGSYEVQLASASANARLALDAYFQCYHHIHSFMSDFITRQCSSTPSPDVDAYASYQLKQRLAEQQQIYIDRSTAVEDAELRLIALRIMLQRDQAMTKGVDVTRPDADPKFDEDSKSDVSETSSRVPTVVEEYFEAARVAFLQDERLVELDDEYKEAAAAREQAHHHAEYSSAFSKRIQETYKQKRQELGAALAIQRDRLHARREACLAQGIDPERFRYRRLSVHNRRPSFPTYGEQCPIKSSATTKDDIPPVGCLRGYESVIGWLQKVA